MRGRLAVVLAAVVALGGAVVAAPAWAAGPPQLVSVSVSANQITVPAQVTVSYTVSSDTPITSGWATYISPDGRIQRVTLSPGTSGSGTLVLPDGVANGSWTLDRVFLYASPSGATTICALGSPYSGSYCTSTVDLSAETVTVSGSTPDYNAPLVSSVTPPSASVQPGGQVAFSWTDDEVHTDSMISLTFKNFDPHAQSDIVTFHTPLNADLSTRHVSFPLKPYAYNGVYQLTELVISDNLGNSATYLPDGTTQLSYRTVSPTSHTLSFSAIAFTVTGSTQGLYPPQLTSLNVTPPTAADVSAPIQIAYTASGPTSPVHVPEVTYLAPDGSSVMAYSPQYGPGTLLLDHQFGTYRLSQITLRDDRGDILTYRRDGRTYNTITGVLGYHWLDFRKYDVTLQPLAPTLLGTWTGPGSLTVRWSTDPDQVNAGVTQTRITVNPGGYTVMSAPNTTGLPSQTQTITGLRNGVTYTLSLTNIGPSHADSPPTSTSLIPGMSDNILSPGDQNHDGLDDLYGYSPASPDGSLSLYRRSGASYASPEVFGGMPPLRRVSPAGPYGVFLVLQDGTLATDVTVGDVDYRQTFGKGWDLMRFMAGGFDFNGGGLPDLYAVSATGELYLYPLELTSTSGISIRTRQLIGSGWSGMQTVFSPGDFNGDHKADLMAIDGSGVLWLYPGNGHGGFGARVMAGTGWSGFGAVFGLRNFSGNGRMDVGAVDMSGNLYRYAGTGTGRFMPGRTLIGTHWDMYF